MISLLMALTATAAVQTPPAATARTLQTVPGITISYYDVEGKTGSAIQKSLDKILKAPMPNTAAQVTVWDVQMEINKRQEGQVCTITAAKAKLVANAYLPRLKEEARVPTDVLNGWKCYVSGLEKNAATNLWYVNDQLPSLEKAVIGQPCDKAQAAYDAALKTLSDGYVAQVKSQMK